MGAFCPGGFVWVFMSGGFCLGSLCPNTSRIMQDFVNILKETF